MPRPTKVLVTSDHAVVCAGLTTLLDDHPMFTTATGSIDTLLLEGADVVLYDVAGLLGTDGHELDRLVKENDVAVLAVSRDLRPELADRALEKGADGCISLDASAEDLAAAVEAAAWGDLHGEHGTDQLDFTGNPARDDTELPHLAPREAEVLGLITAGLSNAEIAERLYLSINSVKTYIRGAYRRIDVRTRSQAVAWCLQHGFTPPPEG